MLIIGLTGGIACGKTVVSRILGEEGAHIIDTDQLARELVYPHTPAWEELKEIFGESILGKDGFIDRKKLADQVFSDPGRREQLNRILHPRIKEEIDRRVSQIGQTEPDAIVVIDAPLLIETGNHRQMDAVIVVRATERQQLERLKERSGTSEEEARRMIASQLPLREKLKVADLVIRNEGTLEETKRRTKEVYRKLKRIALQKKDGF
jgi:dephospho-CoA kinase